MLVLGIRDCFPPAATTVMSGETRCLIGSPGCTLTTVRWTPSRNRLISLRPSLVSTATLRKPPEASIPSRRLLRLPHLQTQHIRQHRQRQHPQQHPTAPTPPHQTALRLSSGPGPTAARPAAGTDTSVEHRCQGSCLRQSRSCGCPRPSQRPIRQPHQEREASNASPLGTIQTRP